MRSASFKEVFSSVDSFLFPIINAHGVLKTPLGKSFGLEPGITTEFSGTSPLISIGSCPVTSIIGVEAVIVTFAPITAPFFYSNSLNNN